MSELSSYKCQEIIDDLWLRPDKELLFMASIIRMVLDERDVWYPIRESENKDDDNESK